MSDPRRIGILAIIFLVVLRMATGWHLLYEGLWKLSKEGTAKPWTAEPYLKNAQGPMRDYLRNLTGDPNDDRWLDAEQVTTRWEEYVTNFKSHYALDKKQTKKLDEFFSGRSDFRGALNNFLPKGVEAKVKKSPSLKKVVKILPPIDKNKDGKIDPKAKGDAQEAGRIIVDGTLHLLPSERRGLERYAPAPKKVKFKDEKKPTPEEKTKQAEYVKQKKIYDAYRKGVSDAFKRSQRLSLKERLLVSLIGDPERAGREFPKHEGTTDFKKIGDLQLYRELLSQYENKYQKAETGFQYEHLTIQLGDLLKRKSELIGPVKELDAELVSFSMGLLTTDQIAKGVPSQPVTQMRRIDLMTMWGLTIAGFLLIAGMFSRIAALVGFGLLIQIYMAFPPLPGYPPVPTDEHALIVNKVLLEALVLWVFVLLPTGRWFGVDAVLGSLFKGSKKETT